ncbi:LTR-retrotransposon skipper [Tieghemostelium lacteum]|uniref:LTR-retrotransposon skipper n=1 Tax=Tieghemostelium lacteum TaxID=361077 RepID=A0A152A4M0_TIELA|nr:LTR-retrotransposon skipper [Tieghemostelium lacteum]|eukprot:KYR01188.1 LTR-retrotransposon skipper [Tieghemostelium lacteum]
MPLPIPSRPFTDISMDFLKLPMTVSGKDNLLVIVCRLSKYVILIPCTSKITAEETAELFINHVLTDHGAPRTIVSDRDPKFTADLWSHLMKRLNVKIKMTVPGRPQADGQTERANRTIIETLMKIGNRNNWDLDIKLTQLALNTAVNTSTKLSPASIVLGYDPKLPSTATNTINDYKDSRDNIKTNTLIAQSNMLEAQLNQARYYNVGRKQIYYSTGDLILVKRSKLNTSLIADYSNEKKLFGRFCGPFRVIKTFDNNVTIRISNKNKKTHTLNVNDIKLFNDEDNIIGKFETDEYQIKDVQMIMSKRQRTYGRGSRTEYLARFNGLNEDHDIWYAESHLLRTDLGSQLVQDYNDSLEIDAIDLVDPENQDIQYTDNESELSDVQDESSDEDFP